MAVLTELPPETIHDILKYVDPADLAWIPRACKALYHAVADNATLFKEVYLRRLDTPPGGQADWEQALKDLVRLQVICSRARVEDKVGLPPSPRKPPGAPLSPLPPPPSASEPPPLTLALAITIPTTGPQLRGANCASSTTR